MQWLTPYIRYCSSLGGWIALGLAVVTTHGVSPALGSCVHQLKGTTYTNLPANFCTGYSDMLLGQHNQAEYSGVICDRSEASYILLQRLIRYNPQGKAIWKVVQIKTIHKPNNQTLVVGAGCQQAASKDPVFALVQATPRQPYQTLSAWKVNLVQADFIELSPQDVQCKPPLISGLED